MRARKSSAKVRLVLIGAMALSGCDNPRYTNRDMYASLADCQKDWGASQSCEAGMQTHPHGAGTQRIWYGPSYNTDFGVPRGRNAMGTSSVARSGLSGSGGSSTSRGGFGSSAAAHGGARG